MAWTQMKKSKLKKVETNFTNWIGVLSYCSRKIPLWRGWGRWEERVINVELNRHWKWGKLPTWQRSNRGKRACTTTRFDHWETFEIIRIEKSYFILIYHVRLDLSKNPLGMGSKSSHTKKIVLCTNWMNQIIT